MDDELTPESKRELEMGIASLEGIRSQVENLGARISQLKGIVLDYESAIEVLKRMEGGKTEEMMVPLGGMVFIKANIRDKDRCITEQGSGIYVEMSLAKAVDQLEDRKKQVGEVLSSMEGSLEELIERYKDLSRKTQELYQKQLQSGYGPEKAF